MRIIFIGLMAFLTLSGCNLFKNKAAREAQVAANILKKTQANQLDFNTLRFSGRAKTQMKEGELSNLSLSYRLEMIKDQEMLLVLRKFVTLARVYITPDSIVALVPLNNEVHYFDYTAASKLLGQPADYQLVQRLVLGEFQALTGSLQPINLKSTPALFTETLKTTRLMYGIDPELYRLRTITAEDSINQRAGNASFENFEKIGNTHVPMTIEIGTTSPDTASISLTHRKVERDETVKIRFSVPEDYTKIYH